MVGEYVGTVLFMIFALGGTKRIKAIVIRILRTHPISVANIPTTSITGEAAAGQDGSQASTANTSNL